MDFKASLSEAEAFFDEPKLLDLPAGVGDVCYDVVIIDGPRGYDANDKCAAGPLCASRRRRLWPGLPVERQRAGLLWASLRSYPHAPAPARMQVAARAHGGGALGR